MTGAEPLLVGSLACNSHSHSNRAHILQQEANQHTYAPPAATAAEGCFARPSYAAVQRACPNTWDAVSQRAGQLVCWRGTAPLAPLDTRATLWCLVLQAGVLLLPTQPSKEGGGAIPHLGLAQPGPIYQVHTHDQSQTGLAL
jgi:hypothetical protein